MRPIRQTVEALVAVPGQPTVHRLSGDAEQLSHLNHRHARLHLQHRTVTLLCHVQLRQHSAQCHASIDIGMSRIKRSRTSRLDQCRISGRP
jgi:hypothetical protein